MAFDYAQLTPQEIATRKAGVLQRDAQVWNKRPFILSNRIAEADVPTLRLFISSVGDLELLDDDEVDSHEITAQQAADATYIHSLLDLNTTVSHTDDAQVVSDEFAATDAKRLLIYDYAQLNIILNEQYLELERFMPDEYKLIDKKPDARPIRNRVSQLLQKILRAYPTQLSSKKNKKTVIQASPADAPAAYGEAKTLLARVVKTRSMDQNLGANERAAWFAFFSMLSLTPDNNDIPLWFSIVCKRFDELFSQNDGWKIYDEPLKFTPAEYANALQSADPHQSQALVTESDVETLRVNNSAGRPQQRDNSAQAQANQRTPSSARPRLPNSSPNSSRQLTSLQNRARSPHVSSQNSSRIVYPDLTHIPRDENAARLARIANQEAVNRAQMQPQSNEVTDADPYEARDIPIQQNDPALVSTIVQTQSVIAEPSQEMDNLTLDENHQSTAQLSSSPTMEPTNVIDSIQPPSNARSSSMTSALTTGIKNVFRRTFSADPNAQAQFQRDSLAPLREMNQNNAANVATNSLRLNRALSQPKAQPQQISPAQMQHALAYAIAVW